MRERPGKSAREKKTSATRTLEYYQHIGHEAVCRNPRNSSICGSSMTRQLGYKQTFRKNVVSTEVVLPYVFVKTKHV